MPLPTIKASSEISQLFSKGKRISNRYVTFIFSDIDEDGINDHDRKGRVAFIAGKRCGNAVWRNSAKRRMREIYRHLASNLGSVDILFIAKPPLMADSYSKVLRTCESTIERLAGRRHHRV